MPTISWFYGIAIQMYFVDHPPPHFKATYGEFEANVSIETGRVIDGKLPRQGKAASTGGSPCEDLDGVAPDRAHGKLGTCQAARDA